MQRCHHLPMLRMVPNSARFSAVTTEEQQKQKQTMNPIHGVATMCKCYELLIQRRSLRLRCNEEKSTRTVESNQAMNLRNRFSHSGSKIGLRAGQFIPVPYVKLEQPIIALPVAHAAPAVISNTGS